MSEVNDVIDSVNDLIQSSTDRFNGKVPGMQEKVLDELSSLLKDLDTKGDKISASVKNLKLISKILRKIEKVIIDPDYKSNVKEYASTFKQISSLQNQYFTAIEENFKPTALLQAIRDETINTVVENLAGSGFKDGVLSPIKSILMQNITTGGSYKDMMKTLSTNLTDGDSGEGIMSRYLKTTVVTSVAQYSRQYSHTVAEGLQFEWYQYVGSTMETTRCFCHAMLEKQYFHKSEIPAILKGDFPEYKEMTCKTNSTTGLPEGMIKGTNVSNFITYAGGYNCQHSIFPVPESMVPQKLRDTIK